MGYVPGDGLRAMDAIHDRREIIFDALPPERKKEVALTMWRGEARLFAIALICSVGCASIAGFRSAFEDHAMWSWMVLVFAALGVLKTFLFTEGCRWACRLRVSWREWPLVLAVYVAVPVIEFATWECGAWKNLYFQVATAGCFVSWLIVWAFLPTEMPEEMDLSKTNRGK